MVEDEGVSGGVVFELEVGVGEAEVVETIFGGGEGGAAIEIAAAG